MDLKRLFCVSVSRDNKFLIASIFPPQGKRMTQRFDHIRFDEISLTKAHGLRVAFENVEDLLDKLPPSRGRMFCFKALEEAFMWAGKAIRDEQIHRLDGFGDGQIWG